jgi:hypothetical protein
VIYDFRKGDESMTDSRNFIYDSNYKPETNFTRVKFGSNIPILETELNEMQILQEKGRTSLVRRLSPSGFIELVSKEFTGEPLIFNPIKKGLVQANSIAIAPCRAIINGYEISIEGNFSYNGFDNYTFIDLGEAPASGVREDLIYLEVWFQTLGAENDVKKWGYQNGDSTSNTMIDSRVNVETSRRIALNWNIRVAHDIEFNDFSQGLGYSDINKYSPIYGFADGSGNLAIKNNTNTIFANAAHDLFKKEEFYRDNNLFVAGRPNYNLKTSSIFGKYVFALPMFRVKRRNKGRYSVVNFNGASISTHTDLLGDSSVFGDLNNNIHPDRLYYDINYAQDIVDLRRSITIKEFNNDYYLDKGLKSLFTGDLQTKDSKQMRRIQFGKSKQVFKDNENVVLVAEFNKSVDPYIPGMPTPIYNAGGNFKYNMSVGGYGVILDSHNYVEYVVPAINTDGGTIDFIMQPYWNGTDDVNQKILSVFDSNDAPIFIFEKNGAQLVWRQYSAASNPTINKISVDLANNLIFANNIYHIRLAWTVSPSINGCFIYINGKLVGQGTYMSSKLIANSLQIGANEGYTDNNPLRGLIMEELVVYKRAFEQNVANSQYSFIDNQYWPNLPPDFIASDTLLYPSFNGVLSSFTDNGGLQENTIVKLNAQPIVEGTNIVSFILNAPCNRIISDNVSPIVYDLTGNVIAGTWVGLHSAQAIFTTDKVEVTSVIVQFNLLAVPGFGTLDLPNELIAAGYIEEVQITEDNGDKTIYYNIKEISFNRKDSTEPRQVKFVSPRRRGSAIDAAYDFSVSNRDKTQAFSRLLYYNVEGTGYANYYIPGNLYGYDVLGVMTVKSRKLLKCTKINDTQTKSWHFEVSLEESVLPGDVIQFVIALSGTTFDYETQSKTIISDIHQTKFIKYTATGSEGDNYISIPCYDDHTFNGGILKSAFTFTDNIFDKTVVPKKIIDTPAYTSGYFNGEMIRQIPQYDSLGNLLSTFKYEVVSMDIKPESFGTPFLKVKFLTKPTAGMVVEIPVLVSYQPLETDKISIWYNHVPYQGILSNATRKLKRISNWKYFMTTLSSGGMAFDVDEDNVYSLNNIVNRLPGGSAYAYIIDGKPIVLNHLSSISSKTNIHSQLTFVDDIVFASDNNNLDNSFFHLDTDFSISKTAKGFQDGELQIQNADFKVYFPDCAQSITKYTGMASLVLDENGEILLLVVGCLNNGVIDDIPSTENVLKPLYGDLYRIPTLPTTIQRY